MATIIERDAGVHTTGSAGPSIAAMVVAFLVLLVVVGLAAYAFRYYGNAPADTNNAGGSIELDVNGQLPVDPAPNNNAPGY